MPFTLAHAAAALPLRRAGLLISALVVGTFGPDFEYFLLLSPHSRYGHHWPGVLILTFPTCLLVLWLYHAYIKRPAAALLPPAVEARLSPLLGEFRFGGLRRFSLIVVSIWVGIATHIAWDWFTHQHSWPARHWPVLLNETTVPLLGSMPIYLVLQHASSFFGMAVLAVWLAGWLRRAKPAAPEPGGFGASHRLAIVAALSVVAAIGAGIRTYVALGAPVPESLAGFYVIWGITAVSFFALELLAYGIWWTRTRSARLLPAKGGC
jgi:hypothetical protein